ncbi:MAG TPA: AAA family ATPase, partial [Dehalococcoidia bacterium]
MLLELDIRNVAIAEHVRLRFSPGLNVLTGETGAGKSIIIDALTVLLGGRADPDLVRGDAAAAQIEGVFRIDEGDAAGVRPLLEEHGIQDEDGLLIISREVPRSGRSVARVNGRAVVQAALSELGARLVDIHGQTDYLSLLRPAEHVHVLDRYAGLTDLRAEVAAAVAEVRRLRAERERIDRDARDRARRMDQLSFEINEIEAANLAPGEEEELRRERSLLANAEQLARLADAAFTALSEGGEGTAAVDALGQAAEHAAELARLDEGAADLAAQAQALQEQAADLAHAMRAYRDGVEFNPERLLEAEERLALINNLKRKYGATVEEVLAYAREARRELEGLTHSEERLEELAAEESRLLARLSELAGALSARRREAAARLA